MTATKNVMAILNKVRAILLLEADVFSINYFTVGGVSNVWNGAGEGIVHSRPSAPSQACAWAFLPPRYVGKTTASKKYNWDKPKPNAPIEAIALKSAN